MAALPSRVSLDLRGKLPGPTCPACCRPWNPSTATQFQQLCAQHAILIPEPASHACPAPAHTGPPSRHSAIVLRPGHVAPQRHMHWAASYHHVRHQWRPEWTCFRCNTTVSPEHPLLHQVPDPPHCPHHGLQRFERGWFCTNGQPCAPTALPTQPTTTTHGANGRDSTHPALDDPRATPTKTRPSQQLALRPVAPCRAGRLQPRAAEAWAQDPRSNHHWQALVQHLREAAPVPWQQFRRISHHQQWRPALNF